MSAKPSLNVRDLASHTVNCQVARRVARPPAPLRILWIGLSLFLVAGLAEAAACAFDPAAVPMQAGESRRGHLWSGAGADAACFAVSVPEAGLLAIELTQRPGAAPAYARLDGVDLDEADGPLDIVRRTAGVLLLDAGPGRVGIRVRGTGSRGVADGRSSFRLSTGFVSYSDLAKDEDDSEIEIEPMDKDEDDSEIEIEPMDKIVADLASIPELDRARLDALCAGTSPGGSLLCARPLDWNVATRGDLAAEWIDEAHVYRFDVSAVGPVSVRARVLGRSDEVAIELLDSSGRRLETWTHPGRAIDQTAFLVPGTYFVRLQSLQGGRSGYSLQLERTDAD